jgi:hypothetical protein
VPHTIDDDPELMHQVGKVMKLSKSATVFKDKGGRYHLTQSPNEYYLPVPKKKILLPVDTKVKILKAVYRILPAGRSDYFKVEIDFKNKKLKIEVHAKGKYKPKWVEAVDR